MTSLFETYLKTWTETRSHDVSTYERPNYVSTDLALDAFEKGKELGKQSFIDELSEKVISMVKENITVASDSGKDIIGVLRENNLKAYKIFISVTPNNSKVIITVDKDEHYSVKFEEKIDPLIEYIENENRKAGRNIEIVTLDESSHLNLAKLKLDGFSFAFDIINEKSLF
ncbi:MAG: hypothetical protein KKD31_06210 [Bacteroidetes bacterium]|nr:hypothetical protein [Bacteroidota bacterium]